MTLEERQTPVKIPNTTKQIFLSDLQPRGSTVTSEKPTSPERTIWPNGTNGEELCLYSIAFTRNKVGHSHRN